MVKRKRADGPNDEGERDALVVPIRERRKSSGAEEVLGVVSREQEIKRSCVRRRRGNTDNY